MEPLTFTAALAPLLARLVLAGGGYVLLVVAVLAWARAATRTHEVSPDD